MDTSRRTFLLGSAVATGLLAGCSRQSSSSTAPTETTRTVQDQPPTCEASDARYLYSATPQGTVIVVERRKRAEELVEQIIQSMDDIGESALSIREVTTEEGTRIVIEVDAGAGATSNLRAHYGNLDDVREVRNGRALPTVRKVGRTLRAALLEADNVEDGQVTVSIVRPGAPKPLSAVAAITGVDSLATLEKAETFSLRAKTPERERTLAEAADIASAETQSDPPGVEITLTKPSRERVERILSQTRILDHPRNPEFTLQVYYEGEKLYDAPLSNGLANAISSGNWDGTMRLTVKTQEEAEEFAKALGLITFSVPTSTTVRQCA